MKKLKLGWGDLRTRWEMENHFLKQDEQKGFTFIHFLWLQFIHCVILPKVCKIKGHKWTIESGGNAESGPMTYHYCERCNIQEGPYFGM